MRAIRPARGPARAWPPASPRSLWLQAPRVESFRKHNTDGIVNERKALIKWQRSLKPTNRYHLPLSTPRYSRLLFIPRLSTVYHPRNVITYLPLPRPSRIYSFLFDTLRLYYSMFTFTLVSSHSLFIAPEITVYLATPHLQLRDIIVYLSLP